ncbi:hypothetical protein FMUND_4505 [Fusarium mundagurra]|uniref:Uncharacterized protein n=1 Tax=Fusarium mundagurra TaxID=1567541 RepID=A0A8H6DK18_9HYPO|nr:hypothetical protein FMUND_4505 [Fusarium mundagurra]
MLLPKLPLLAVMAILVAALNCRNEITVATIDRNWLLSGCGPCRKDPFPNDDADGFSNYGPRQPGSDDYGFKQPDKDINSPTTVLSLPKETPTITSSRTTQTKPRVGWLTPPGPDGGATFNNNDPQQPGRDDDGPKQPENDIASSIAALKHPKETPSITSIRITQTKPRVGWSTLPGPDDGTTLAWFTKTTTHTETETTTTTASTTIDLRKDTITSMGLSETTATSMSPRKSTATSMGLTETSATLDPEETDTPTPQKEKRSAGLQTAGIIMAILFFILFTGLIAWKCHHHRQQIQFDEGPEEPMGEAGGSAFDDSDSEADGVQARNLIVSVRDWFRRHQFPFPPPNESGDPAPDGEEPDEEEPEPHPDPPALPPPPERPVQAAVAAVHSNIPPTRSAIPGRQVRAPSVQVPTPDPAQDRSSSSVYSQDSGHPGSLEIPRPLPIHRSRHRQEEPQSPREWRTTGEPVQTEHYGWI